MPVNKKYIFVYSNSPDSRETVVRGIFPYEMLKEATEFNNSGSGYLKMRLAEWNGFGELPEYTATAPMKEI